MKKKVTSLLLVFVMILSLLVPAYAASTSAPDTLVIATNESEAYPGDDITFTVSIGPVTNLAGIQFQLATPAGMTLKEGALADGLKAKLGVDGGCAFNEENGTVLIVGGMDYTSSENTDILSVTYTVNEKYTGEVTLGVNADNMMFIDTDNNQIKMTVLNAGSKVTVVKKPVPATGISINKTSLSLEVGESTKLEATIVPADSTETATWVSDNTAVATVAADGTVTAVAKGLAVITATAGNYSASCTVSVACKHTNTVTVDAVTGNCVNPGHAQYVYCEDCTVVLSGSDAPITGPHGAYVEKVADEYLKSAADCNNAAVYYKSCEFCGEASDTETFVSGDAASHVYADTLSKGANGHWYACLKCGDKKDLEAHTFVDDVCTECNYQQNHKHGLTLVPAVEATCETAGVKAYYICTECDDIFADENATVEITNKAELNVEALGHKWVDATCTEAKTCSVCKATKGSALGHKWTDATCTTAKTCSACNETQGKALGHKWTEATCTTAKTCSVCDAKQGKALGHKWTEATCTTAKTCTVCAAKQGKALGHNWTEATCTTAKTCSVCKATQGKALGHKWVDATCTAAKTCSVCKETQGNALGHKYGAWVVVTAATSSAEGKEERACSVCKAKESRKIEKLAYVLGDADNNGSIKAADARIALRIASKIDTVEKYNIDIAVIDLNFDGKITAADARTILRISAKLETTPVKP